VILTNQVSGVGCQLSENREPQNTEQGIMNVEVGQPSVAAMEVGTEADPTSSFPLTADSVFCGSLLSDRGTPETYL